MIVDDASGPAVRALLGSLDGDVVVRRVERRVGRRAALAFAAEAAHSVTCIALGPLARPRPGFAAPLDAAVRAGAALAAPVLVTAAGEIHGYRAGADGSLWPLAAGEAAPDALALDCLAAPRSFWLADLPAFSARDGHYEVAVADAARRRGPLAVVPESRVGRASVGEPASVIVCSLDRADELAACVDALVAHGVLAGGNEIVIVDNGSTDGTAEVARAAAARHAGITVVHEPVHGLSRARNTGAAAARHDLLCYLDDDARPAPGWLEHLRDAFVDPAVQIAGGPIHGLWPAERPEGWPAPDFALEGYFSVLDLGDADLVRDESPLYGANWAARRSALERAGGFDQRWGTSDDCKLVADETCVAFRLADLGAGRTAYAPGAAVGHRVSSGRVDEGWLVLRACRHGVEVPHVLARFEEPSRELATRVATEAAAELHAIAALDGRYDVDGALAEIAGSPLPLQHRVCAARALGIVASSVLLLGESECMLGPLQLTVRPEHANGDIARPPALLRAAA